MSHSYIQAFGVGAEAEKEATKKKLAEKKAELEEKTRRKSQSGKRNCR